MKVMIAEDEILVRLGLRKAIPWSSLGMELVCEAKDGEEAYEMFKQHAPDIVLVDIEMPKMDGLKFIRYAKTSRVDTRFIVLTCHQDMKYTREAIQLQVSDFMLKSTLDMDELCGILRNISLDIVRERAESERSQLRLAQPELGTDTPAPAFMRDWLNGAMPDSAAIHRRLKEMGHEPKADRYRACVLQVDPSSGMDWKGAERLIKAQCGTHVIGGADQPANGRCHFIVADGLAVSDVPRWKRTLKEQGGFRVSVSISAPFANLHEWPAYDRQAAETLQLQYYGGESGVYDEHRSMTEAMPEPVKRLRRELNDLIVSMRFAAARRKMAELETALRQPPHLHPNIVKNMLTEFLFRAWSACEEIVPGKQAANHQLVDQMYASERLEQTVSLLLRDLERVESHALLTNTAEDKAKIIVLIKQYIKTHLQEEVTLQEIANTFYINSTYLSRLFKEVSSVSFTEFVLHEKTELAILMMKNGKSLTEISERLGYLNLSSFTRMFKKVRGVSPSRYLREERNHSAEPRMINRQQ